MGTLDRPSLFRPSAPLGALLVLLGGAGGCAPARVPGAGPRPWPENAVDREIRRLSELAVAELEAAPGPAQVARHQALWERLQRLPAEESRPYRLDRALLAGHLGRALGQSVQTRGATETASSGGARTAEVFQPAARDLVDRLAAAGVPEARSLEPAGASVEATATATTAALEAVMLALAARVRPSLPLSPARRSFEAPGFRAAWVALGPRFAHDLGATPEPADRSTTGGLAWAYERIRARRGAEFRPWDVMRVLLGLGSDDPVRVEDALAGSL